MEDGSCRKIWTAIDSDGVKRVTKEASIKSAGIPKIDGPAIIVPANSLELNGNAMTELSVANGFRKRLGRCILVKQQYCFQWPFRIDDRQRENEIIIPASDVNFSGNTLVINGATVNVSSVTDMTGLISGLMRKPAAQTPWRRD